MTPLPKSVHSTPHQFNVPQGLNVKQSSTGTEEQAFRQVMLRDKVNRKSRFNSEEAGDCLIGSVQPIVSLFQLQPKDSDTQRQILRQELSASKSSKTFMLMVIFLPKRGVNSIRRLARCSLTDLSSFSCCRCRVKNCATGLSAKTSITVRNFSKEKPGPAASVTRIAFKHAGHANSSERLRNGILMATAAVLGGSVSAVPRRSASSRLLASRAAYFSFATCCSSAVKP